MNVPGAAACSLTILPYFPSSTHLGYPLSIRRHMRNTVLILTCTIGFQFINLASNSDFRVGFGLESCTNVVQLARPFELHGRNVFLIDTPGFDDTSKSDTDVLKMIAAFLATALVV